MSYAVMDHAGWVEEAISAHRGRLAKSKRATRSRGWDAAPEKLSPFQARVFDILGMVYGGIYNAPISWETVEWDYGGHDGMSVTVGGRSLATFDFGTLTALVFLCHEARIRAELAPCGPRNLRLSFWQRKPHGGMSERHPSLLEAVTAFRAYLPRDHRVIYREDVLT